MPSHNRIRRTALVNTIFNRYCLRWTGEAVGSNRPLVASKNERCLMSRMLLFLTSGAFCDGTGAFCDGTSRYAVPENLENIVYIFFTPLRSKVERLGFLSVSFVASLSSWFFIHLFFIGIWTKRGRIMGFYYVRHIEFYINVYIIVRFGKYLFQRALHITIRYKITGINLSKACLRWQIVKISWQHTGTVTKGRATKQIKRIYCDLVTVLILIQLDRLSRTAKPKIFSRSLKNSKLLWLAKSFAIEH